MGVKGQVLGSKDNTENKIVKTFIIVGDSERHMGVNHTIFFTLLGEFYNKS